MRIHRVLALVLAAGAGCAYRPGSLLEVRPGEPAVARQIGCLDVAISVTGDAAVPDLDPVVTIKFGNRCDRRLDVDLGALVVRATYGGAGGHRLAAYDPRGEIRRLPLDARGQGVERIEYQTPPGVLGPPRRLCIEVAAIAPGERWPGLAPICFTSDGERLLPEDGPP